MIVFSVDYGTWEKGKTLKVEASDYEQALDLANKEAQKKGLGGNPLQVKESGNRKLHWDAWNGSYTD